MKKRIISILLAVAIICAMLPQISSFANAATYSGTCGDNLKWTLDTNTGLLSVTGSGWMPDYTNMNASTVCPWADYREFIKMVSLPEGLTHIGIEAFFGCENLQKITIPDSVTSIGREAFSGCKELESVSVGKGLGSIASNVFYGCKAIKSFTILNPNCVIYDRVDTVGCPFLTCIYGYNYSTAQTYAEKYGYEFQSLGWSDQNPGNELYNYLLDYYFTNNIQTRCFYRFYSDGTFEEYYYDYSDPDFDERNTTEEHLILNTSGYRKYEIKNNALYLYTTISGTKYTDILNPVLKSDPIDWDRGMAWPSVLDANEYFFYETSFITPDSFVDDNAMWLMRAMPTEKKHSGKLFGNTSWTLDEVTGKLTISGTGEINFSDPNQDGIYSPPWEHYRKQIKEIIIQEGITSIGDDAVFSDCVNAVHISLPQSLKKIGWGAFMRCRSLGNIELPSSLSEILASFSQCSRLNEIVIPKSVTHLGAGSFDECINLKKIIIENPNCSIDGFSTTLGDKSVTTIYGFENSTAQTHAEKFGYTFKLLEEKLEEQPGFNTFFVNNYYDNLNALYNYESVAQGIKTSSFQIVWNTCLQALSNSNYIDISKLENHPEYYYEVVLVEAISQKELNDDYLSALKTEAFDLVLDAADVFISYDANFNSREEILEAKLTETINLFDGTSEGAHALYQAFMGCVSYKSYKDFYDEAKFVYDACKEAGSTCSDFLTELSNYQVAQQASAEVIEALKYLRSTLEDSSDKEEKNIASAIDDFIQLYSESIGETALRQASEAIDEQLRGTLFRAAKLIPIFGNAVDLEQAGLNAVFTFSDVLFPTTMSSENYCKIYADYAMECVLRNAMQSACSSRSTVGDDVIVGLYDLLGFTYKHEIQVAQVLAEQLYHDGLLNGLRNLFTDREERYNYDNACIKAYQADLYQILGKKTDAIREYGLEIGASQIVTLVFMQNGKVIACSELAIPTGSTYSPSTGTFDLGGFFNTKIEIGTFYTDAALTIPYDKDQKVYSPVSLYCNVKLTDLSSNAPIMVDYSTGIYVEQNGIDETAILHTKEKHDGASYDLINNTLKSNAFSLYDISLLKNGTPVQPTETVTVRIPISEADTKKAGKVYRVENNSKFTDMASWIEGGYYCFNTNHFSEYVVAFEPLISDDVICDGGVNCPSNKFIDVNQKEWYHSYVDYAVTHGLFGGTSENTFEPDSTMTRSMLVTVLWRYEGQPKGYKNTFADVNAKNGGWYIDAVAWAAANNIVGGVGGGKFDPEGIVTREQMATILYRYSEWKGFDTSKRADFSSFPDANKVSSWAKTAMKWAVAEGLIGGSKEGNATYILPTNGATRAQVATILMRYIQGLTEEIPYDPMGHSYEYVRGMYSWAQAQKIAEEKGGYLVRFDSLREFNYIATQLSKNEYQNTVFVIGARRAESSKDYYFVDFNDKPIGGKINDSSWFSSCWAAGEPTYEWDGVQEWILAMAYDSSHSTWKINDIVDNLSYPSDPNCHGFIIEYDNKDDPAPEESYHIALITDYGDINDASYNQAAYEAGRAWCEKNSADFTYYKPIEDSTEARVAVIDQAVADGYNVLILPGFTFADPIVETAGLYPDVRFIGLDISEDDLKFAAYDNPTYTCPSNVFCALYKEEIGGFMAGYAAVKLGYTKLGFLGGMPVPAVVRYGYGFIQGVDTASTELGIKTEIRYVYGNQFFGDADITAYMENWYRSGTQVVFACGGGIFTSAAEAAQKYSGKLIGLDVDQASTIDELYGTGMTVTSAMKGLGETVTFMLDELINGRWNVHGGKVEMLGLISGSDPSANFVQLPDSTQWNSGFTKSDYAALVSKIYNGTYIVSADIDIMPTTKSVTVLNEGAIKS